MIKYTNRNRILRDFSKFSGLPRSEVAGKLNKTFGGNRKGFKTEVLVSREKHFVLAYNRKRKQVTLACNYGCWNELVTVLMGSNKYEASNYLLFLILL